MLTAKTLLWPYYYNYYYYKSTDYSDASQSCRGTLHIRFKNDGSSQKSVVRQLKQMGLCLPSKRQQRRGGPDLCWQTIPRPHRCHRKAMVAKSYPTSWRHQQRSRVGRAKMATVDKLWCRSAACCLQNTPVLCHAHSDMPEHATETGFVPVHVTSEGSGAVGSVLWHPTRIDEWNSGIQHRLQPVLQVSSSTCKDRVAVVQLDNDHWCMDQC